MVGGNLVYVVQVEIVDGFFGQLQMVEMYGIEGIVEQVQGFR